MPNRRSRSIVLAGVLGGIGALVAPAAAVATRPDVLLITVDTLRPDALGWVAGRNATPAIDALAASGFRFPRAIAPAPLTLPSHVSMMTGLTPRRHGVRDNGRLLPTSGPETLAERLRATGYSTAAFVSGFPLAAMFGLDRGFERYDDRFESRPAGGGELERPAAATADAALAWLATVPRPRFLWVHFYDPHDPYAGAPAGPDATAAGLRAAYDGEVRAVDAAIARLRAAARPAGETLTVFAADHGESLGEHGETTHGFFVYQSTIEVPLVLAWPGRLPPGQSAARVRLVDLAPTVLGLLGLPAWTDREGVSLEPWLRGATSSAPPAFVETRRPWHSYGWAPLEAVVDGELKLIAAPRPELYDLTADPLESRDRLDTDRRSARRLADLLDAHAGAPAARSEALDDPETVARLRALGYVGGGDAADAEPPTGLPDPKDRIEAWNRLGRAEASLANGAPAAALVDFDAVLADEPGNPFALARSAEALLGLGRAGEAEERLRRAAPLAPRQAEIRAALAGLLHRQRRFAEAAAQWAALVRLRPRDVTAWQNMGAALGRSGRTGEAVGAFARAAELSPGSAEAQTRLAFAAVAAGDRARAVAALERSAGLAPPGTFAHSCTLGILLDDLDRSAESRARLLACAPGHGDFAEARLRLARQWLEAGERDRARAALAEAIAADPAIEARARADRRFAALF